MSKLFIPINDQVIIEKQLTEATSSKGFIIPEGAQTDMTVGIVIAIGPGQPSFKDPEQRVPMMVKVGDKVIVPKFNHKIEWNDKEYFITRENEIYAIVNE